MKSKLIIYILGLGFLIIACTDRSIQEGQNNSSNPKVDQDIPDQITKTDKDSVTFSPDKNKNESEEFQKRLTNKSDKSILDYYYLLPSSPYFERELGDDTKTERDSGIVHLNLKSGYLIGGHRMGPNFTMALFKNRKENKDYIMIQRIQYPGEMFHGFFDFITFTHNNKWVSADSIFTNTRNEKEKTLLENIKSDELCTPVIPESGTVIEFRKWNPVNNEDHRKGTLLYKYKWNGQSFDFVEVKH